MSRAKIKTLKNTVHLGTRLSASESDIRAARDAALQLLQHSVKFGHARLAIIRLVDAVKLEAVVGSDLWDYFEGVDHALATPGQIQALRTMSQPCSPG